MIVGIYCIKDEKVGFLQVMQDSNDMTALRNFEFAMNRDDTMFNMNKADFRLYKLGTFDTLTAEIVLESTPLLIASADSL